MVNTRSKYCYLRGFMGVPEALEALHELTTNQKVAGSSPAERATKSPANAAFLPLLIDVKVGLCPPFDHLSFYKRLRRGSVYGRSRVPVLDPLRIHHAVGISRFLVTTDDTSSPIVLFLNYGVPTRRRTVRKPFRKPFLHYSLMPVIWDVPGSLASHADRVDAGDSTCRRLSVSE
jgi:hypothetical protein